MSSASTRPPSQRQSAIETKQKKPWGEKKFKRTADERAAEVKEARLAKEASKELLARKRAAAKASTFQEPSAPVVATKSQRRLHTRHEQVNDSEPEDEAISLTVPRPTYRKQPVPSHSVRSGRASLDQDVEAEEHDSEDDEDVELEEFDEEEHEEELEEDSDEEAASDEEPDYMVEFDERFKETAILRHSRIQRRDSAGSEGSLSASQSRAAHPSTTDDDNLADADEPDSQSEREGPSDFEAELAAKRRKISTATGRMIHKSVHREVEVEKQPTAVTQKLRQEKPIIGDKRHPHRSKRDVSPESESESDSEHWVSRSDIVLSHQTPTPRVNIKEQNKWIQNVIRRAVDLGEIYLVLGIPDERDTLPADAASSMHTPFSVSGLHHFAITALIDAAEELGYTSKGDISERLVSGSQRTYIKPLGNHVFHRLGIARSSILGKITAALALILKLDKTKKALLGLLMSSSNYIYPFKAGSEDSFVRTRLYSSEIITQALKLGFGTLDIIHLPKLYRSTVTATADPADGTLTRAPKPTEREVPAEMVAMAATTAYGVLQHLLFDSSGGLTDFSAPALQSAYQGHMVRLGEWSRRYPARYHRFMHLHYSSLIGVGCGIVGDQTTQEIINEVDWDHMGDSDGEVGGN